MVSWEPPNSRYSVTPTATTATTAAIAAEATTAAATTISCHLGETGINVLLGLLKNVDKVPRLLSICWTTWLVKLRHTKAGERTYCQW